MLSVFYAIYNWCEGVINNGAGLKLLPFYSSPLTNDSFRCLFGEWSSSSSLGQQQKNIWFYKF